MTIYSLIIDFFDDAGSISNGDEVQSHSSRDLSWQKNVLISSFLQSEPQYDGLAFWMQLNSKGQTVVLSQA